MRPAPNRSLRMGVAAALIPLGTLAVHQLRYLVDFGSDAGRVLTEQGDGYAETLLPWLVGLAGLAVAVTALRALRSERMVGCRDGRPRIQTLALFAMASSMLVGGYLIQETLEVLVGDAHQSLWLQAFGSGGWIALVLALAIGLLWALLVRGALGAVSLVRRMRTRRSRTDRREPISGVRPRLCRHSRSSPLARRLAERAPPLAMSLV